MELNHGQMMQLDASLVMNVLNRIAAKNYGDERVEPQIVYSLSDYLREGLKIQQSAARPQDLLKLAETHMRLVAGMRDIELDALVLIYTSRFSGRLCNEIVKVGMAMIESSDGSAGQKWKMKMLVKDIIGVDDHVILEVDLGGILKLSNGLNTSPIKFQRALTIKLPQNKIISIRLHPGLPKRLTLNFLLST